MESSSKNSIREFFNNSETNLNNQSEEYVLVEIEIIYKDEPISTSSSMNSENKFEEELISKTSSKSDDIGIPAMNSPFEDLKNSLPLESYKNTATISIPYSKIQGTFIEDELKKTDDNSNNYIKIELKAKKNKIMLESIINCFEYIINKNYNFQYTKDNLISYFHAFSLCRLHLKRKEVLERLLQDLIDENIIYFLKVVATLDDEFLHSYSFWLVRYLINLSEKQPEITFNGYNYGKIVKLTSGCNFRYDDQRIFFSTGKVPNLLSSNLSFLNKYFENIYKSDLNKYFTVNNHFNMGRVLRRKSDDSIVDDYPHFYQLILENEPNLFLYAIRPSENANFLISRSIDDFSKYGINYVAEIVPNFWGTYFDIYDYGYEKSLYERTPKMISKIRKNIGSITYETNIMGECPRYFKIDIIQNNEIHRLQNLKPEFNEAMDCYCLNFYGRVKKASAKNFQIIYPDDNDNILLQHGKINRDEYNIDFREPFNFVFAFAVSLVAIGKKRVVS